MSCGIWKRAGTYRQYELDTDCDPRETTRRLAQLLGNIQHWLDNNTFPIDEPPIRFHYQLVSKIRPFPNGNGRHARMIADVPAVKRRRHLPWGSGCDLVQEGNVRTLYLAALRTVDTNDQDVEPLLIFAHS